MNSYWEKTMAGFKLPYILIIVVCLLPLVSLPVYADSPTEGQQQGETDFVYTEIGRASCRERV